MRARRILALIFNMVGSGIPLLFNSLFALVFVVVALTVSGAGASVAGIALLFLVLFAVLIALIILNIVHFVRYTKNQYHSFDRYTILLGVYNLICSAIITLVYVLLLNEPSVIQNHSVMSLISGAMMTGMSIPLIITAIVLGIISMHKDAVRFPNA